MPERPRTLLLGGATAVGGALLALTVSAPALAASTATCRTALTGTLDTRDPTTLQDRPVATVRLSGARSATGVRVTVTRRGRTLATGRAAGTVRTGTAPVELRLRGTPARGPVRIVVRGRVAGCGTVRGTASWRLSAPSLPVRATLRATTVVAGRSVVRVQLRPVAGRRSRGVRVALLNAAGKRVASANVPGTLSGPTEVALQAAGTLPSGAYRVTASGRAGGSATMRATAAVVLSAASTDPSAASATPSRQRAVVDWSGGKPTGRDVAGFVLPGIGHGEILCRPDAQGLRVYPTDLRRETSLLNWTYKDWGATADTREKALREALATTGTGRDFSEGLNKFTPPEKTSTGEFVALLTDRGTIAGPGDAALAAPVGVRVTWVWDFTSTGSARCHAEAEVVAQTAGSTGIASAQVVWRGDAAAAGRDVAGTDIPGVGRLTVVCQAGPAGIRNITLATGAGGTVTTRQASEDVAVPQTAGPIIAELPNNGQVQIEAAGVRILVSSRWKVNDPDPGQNRCSVAAQAVVG
ncbi:hypothetical protein [Patulibacter americanus]|uniref:hypothetical protein n=1 Tax=Patulibacter americanus TaxID=588672 RepID=UPI0003B58635|nr:hypothetical protein [Patulibacter americanus]